MVEVDLTLLVQIFHFIIAYVILRVFLWRPIITYLQAEERHRALLNDELAKQRTIVEQKEFDLLKIQSEAQQAFIRSLPSLKTIPLTKSFLPVFSVKKTAISPESFDTLVSIIVQKVEE